MKIRLSNANDNIPLNVTGDLIALLAVFIIGVLMSLGGVAFGLYHYQHEIHLDRNYQEIKND